MNRAELFSSLQSRPPDVLIVGAGINGVGTFRDLALNGVNVAIIDRGDFCSGASSASSHMAHGGIRYLENGEFRLVREAVQERNRMIVNAPHIVRPLPTVVPIFKFFSGILNAPLKFLNVLDRPAERGALVIKIGLILYDLFTLVQRTVPMHRFDGRAASLKEYPHLASDIQFTATYYDGQILSPERYTVELLLDGEADGGRALNYVSLTGFADNGLTVRDELTGATLALQPKLLINAAGPWIDLVNDRIGIDADYIGGTKGSHLVLNHPQLCAAIRGREFFFENKDGRIVLIFPFYDKVIIGTSDIPFDHPDEARCTPAEMEYFFELVSRVFPSIQVGPEHVIFHFCGVRPLEKVSAKTAGQITRDHSIKENVIAGLRVYSLVGGKWTSYRAFAEQVTDKVLALFSQTRQADTRKRSIGGGRNYPLNPAAKAACIQNIAKAGDLSETRAETLFSRYGTRALDIAAFLRSAGDQPLQSLPEWSVGEVQFLAAFEKVVHLDDLIIRRSNLAWLGQVGWDQLVELAGTLYPDDEKRAQAEAERAAALLRDRHGVHLLPPKKRAI